MAPAKKDPMKLEKLRLEAQKKTKRKELQRELTTHALNRDELDRTWRELMLKIKEPIFRKDMYVLWHTFERAYDKQDCLINYTMKLLNVAEDQFQRCFTSFCNTIDTMIIKFLAELEDLSSLNDINTAALLKRGEDEANIIMNYQEEAETHLQLMLYHAHTTSDNKIWYRRGALSVKEDEEVEILFNIREDLVSFLENNYNAMWEEYKSVLKLYVSDTSEYQKNGRKLRKKETKMADIIASQGRKIANSDNVLRKLKIDMEAYESGTKQAVFRDRRNRHRAACFNMKENLKQNCHTDEIQLSVLVKATDTAVEWLEAAQKKGEKILRVAQLCRRYETRREKVLPYGTAMPHSPTALKTPTQTISQGDDPLVANGLSSTSSLTRIWQRVAKADLSRRALLREKIILEEENQAMERTLRKLKEESENIKPNATSCICHEINKFRK